MVHCMGSAPSTSIQYDDWHALVGTHRRRRFRRDDSKRRPEPPGGGPGPENAPGPAARGVSKGHFDDARGRRAAQSANAPRRDDPPPPSFPPARASKRRGGPDVDALRGWTCANGGAGRTPAGGRPKPFFVFVDRLRVRDDKTPIAPDDARAWRGWPVSQSSGRARRGEAGGSKV